MPILSSFFCFAPFLILSIFNYLYRSTSDSMKPQFRCVRLRVMSPGTFESLFNF